MTTNKKTQITIDVNLDENKIPEKISWSAKDGGISKMESRLYYFHFGIQKIKKHLKWIYGLKICHWIR
ncbi:MAG: hypothetical protein CM15mP122_2710 [Bacteroidota bacterium]|nr:MAG: hypothetical protein CM15mP122_2710 [Bacteroidota bacterium]